MLASPWRAIPNNYTTAGTPKNVATKGFLDVLQILKEDASCTSEGGSELGAEFVPTNPVSVDEEHCDV